MKRTENDKKLKEARVRGRVRRRREHRESVRRRGEDRESIRRRGEDRESESTKEILWIDQSSPSPKWRQAGAPRLSEELPQTSSLYSENLHPKGLINVSLLERKRHVLRGGCQMELRPNY